MTPAEKLATLRTIPGDNTSPLLRVYADDVPAFALDEHILTSSYAARPYAILVGLAINPQETHHGDALVQHLFDVILERIASADYPLSGDTYAQEATFKASLENLTAEVISEIPECNEIADGFYLLSNPSYIGESPIYPIGRSRLNGYGKTITFSCQFWR